MPHRESKPFVPTDVGFHQITFTWRNGAFTAEEFAQAKDAAGEMDPEGPSVEYELWDLLTAKEQAAIATMFLRRLDLAKAVIIKEV